jgi:dolichol-phosphate mannosyltransferase
MNDLLTILIPVRNEKENVHIITEEIQKKIDNPNFEILFINDFSEDSTKEELEKICKLNQKVVYFDNNRKGLGGAMDLGFQKSKGKYICIFMCDSSDTVEDLNRYYDEIVKKDLDAVLGSRFIRGGKIVDYPYIKLVFNRIGNLMAKFLLWTDLNDFTNGFKIYKKDTLLNLYPLVSEDFNIFFELPIKTITRGFKYSIIPVSYYNRKVGVAKFKIEELGSKYVFTLIYCFFEKILLKKKNN